MGTADLWLIVEGREHDRPHYERLFESLPETRDLRVTIRLAEQIDIDHVVAGGKDHALALHDYWQMSGELKQSNRAGFRRIAFALDRDRDDFVGCMRSTPNVMYTLGVDVECDILNEGDLWRALKSAYGVTREHCEAIMSSVGDPRDALRETWNEWIALGLLATAIDSSFQPRFGQHSQVNIDVWGSTDPSAASKLRRQLLASSTPSDRRALESRVEAHMNSRGRELLKGRWIARYIWELVRRLLGTQIIRANVQFDTVVSTALETIDYSERWTDPYSQKARDLFAA